MPQKTRPLLVLLTINFPFGEGEEFLETEIIFLRKNFKTEIIPTEHSYNIKRKRSIPSDVIVHNIPSCNNLVYLTWWLFRKPHSILKIFRLFIAETKSRKITLKGYTQLFSFAVKAVYLYQTLKMIYDNRKITFMYSYWLSKGALAASIWKQYNKNSLAISRAHRFDLYHFRSASCLQPYQKVMISTLDRIFPCSNHGERYLKRIYQEHSVKIQAQRLGVLPAPERNDSPSDNTLHIVSCAYLSPVKRVHLLVEALHKCQSSIHWTHLGGGELQPIIKQLASSLPCNISWQITGVISNKEVLEFYKNKPVDLFINTSESEGLPVSIMEAMSFGIPIAATDVGGTSELVIDGYNGYLWPHDVTPGDISKTMDTFSELTPTARGIIREAAWQTWNEKVNAKTQYSNFTRILLEMINNG